MNLGNLKRIKTLPIEDLLRDEGIKTILHSCFIDKLKAALAADGKTDFKIAIPNYQFHNVGDTFAIYKENFDLLLEKGQIVSTGGWKFGPAEKSRIPIFELRFSL
jgi:hypothetical protein